MAELLVLLRPRNAVPPLLWLLVGYAAGGATNYRSAPLTLCFIGLALLNFFATAQNDLEDFDIDKDSGRRSALTDGRVSKNSLRLIGRFMAGLALVLPLIFWQPRVFWLLLIYLLVCWLYNSPPAQLSRRPVASITALGLCFAALPFLYGWIISSGPLSSAVIWLIAGGFLLRFSLSALKDYKDYYGDKKNSKQTFLIRFGPHKLRSISMFMFVAGLALIILAALSDLGAKAGALFLAAFAIYMISERAKLKAGKNYFDYNNRLFHKLLTLGILFEAGVWACFYIY